MLYIVEESWKYPDETDHSYYHRAFHSKEDALLKAKEMIKDEEQLFNLINKEYYTVVLNDSILLKTIDSEFEYTVNVVSIEEDVACMPVYEVFRMYNIISNKYKQFISDQKQEPDFVEVPIRWKDDNKTEVAYIALNKKNDDLVTFRVNNLAELALLFFKESREDFICEHVHNMYFGIWDG